LPSFSRASRRSAAIKAPINISIFNPSNLPDPDAKGYGYKSFSSQSLFASSGPSKDDIHQGGLGDCYFLAGLSAVAKTAPNVIQQSIVDLGDDNISFDADTFELASAGSTTSVEVTATIPAQLIAGVSLDAATLQFQNRLTQLFTGAAPGTAIDIQTVLTALRDDAKYAIDPLRLKITLAAGPQFVDIGQGAPPYTVAPGQTFVVKPVTVTT